MNKAELVRLKRLLKKEIDRANRINELLRNNLIQEFLLLNKLDIREITLDDKWNILEKLLREFQITETNGILVCTGSYVVECNICYQETYYYEQSVSFDSSYKEYQTFRDIETSKLYTGYVDKYIETMLDKENSYYPKTEMTPSEFCRSRYGRYLVSELKEKYVILNPYNKSENENGFNEVRKDFFEAAIEKGQSKAKQLVLSKYPQMK